MNSRNCLALAMTAVFAVGCASARAQDDPPPGPPPRREARNEVSPEVREEMRETEKRIRALREEFAQTEERLADMQSGGGMGDNHPDVVESRRRLKSARAALERAQAERSKLIVENRIAPQPIDLEFGSSQNGRNLRDAAREQLHIELMRDGHRRPQGQGPGANVPRPTLEQRMEQLERAVREMHSMFERHNVAPEARERAEREMRERREEQHHAGRPGEGNRGAEVGRPGEPVRPGEGDRGGEGGRPGERGAPSREAGGERPRPPMPRAEARTKDGRLGVEITTPSMDEARKQLEHARAEMDTMRRQLEEQRAAMEKMRAEIEELRAKK